MCRKVEIMTANKGLFEKKNVDLVYTWREFINAGSVESLVYGKCFFKWSHKCQMLWFHVLMVFIFLLLIIDIFCCLLLIILH